MRGVVLYRLMGMLMGILGYPGLGEIENCDQNDDC